MKHLLGTFGNSLTSLLLVVLSSSCWAESAAQQRPLDGLYMMTRMSPVGGLELAAYYFQNGTAVLNPVVGGKRLDVEGERAAHPKAVGTYRLAGGQLTLTFPDSNITARFEVETEGCFGWDAGSFCPVEIFKPGTTLNGMFTGGASVGGGALSTATDVSFKADGTYQRESVASYRAQGRVSTTSGGSTGQDRGKYRIDGTALHMMPDGGKEYVVTTFPYDDGSKGAAPRRVYFGGAMLKQK